MWISLNEGAKFWLSVLTELKNRGLEDIFIASVDGTQISSDDVNITISDVHHNLEKNESSDPQDGELSENDDNDDDDDN